MENLVILVDDSDKQIGTMPISKAHAEAKLHRAFAVFIFTTSGKLILQQRSNSKLHSPGLWSNTCCSHPLPGDTINVAAHRRLYHELGFDCSFDYKFAYQYSAKFEDNVIENEIDHIIMGVSNQLPSINPTEVNAYKTLSLQEISVDLLFNPHKYTKWFQLSFGKIAKIFENIV